MIYFSKIWIDTKYWIKRKVWQIRNIIRWIPVLWKQYDFDYIYAIEVFRFQLSKIEKFLESDKSCTVSATKKAKEIRKVIKLMDRVYGDKHEKEYYKHIESMYGKHDIEFDNGEMKVVWENDYNSKELNEIDKKSIKLLKEYNKKENDEHKLLWKMVEKNIKGWWD